MESLETFRLFLLGDLGQQPSTVETNLTLIKKILRDADPLRVDSVKPVITQLILLGREKDYIAQHIAVIRHWGECFHISDLATYPYPKLKRRNKYVRATMSDEEILAFLNLPNPFKEGSVYWKRYEMWNVFWWIGAFHGDRPGERVKLRKIPTKEEPSYIDFGRDLIIFEGKVGVRKVPLSFVVRNKAKWYMENILEGDYLFPPLHKSNLPYMKGESWQEDFTKRIRRLEEQFPGISQRPNLEPYSLRHSAPTRWNDENWSIRKIQEALGHKKLDTTQKYLHVSEKAVAEMINNDRLTLQFKKGIDIVRFYFELMQKAEKEYKGKVFIDIRKQSKDGKKLMVLLEAID
jgi:integrase